MVWVPLTSAAVFSVVVHVLAQEAMVAAVTPSIATVTAPAGAVAFAGCVTDALNVTVGVP